MYVGGSAVISGNTAAKYFEVYGEDDSGKNVWCYQYCDYVTDDVYLDLSQTENYPTRSYIQLSGPLTEGACIVVTTSIEPTEDSTAENGTDHYASSAQYFFSDEGYAVRANADDGYVELYIGSGEDDTEEPDDTEQPGDTEEPCESDEDED